MNIEDFKEIELFEKVYLTDLDNNDSLVKDFIL